MSRANDTSVWGAGAGACALTSAASEAVAIAASAAEETWPRIGCLLTACFLEELSMDLPAPQDGAVLDQIVPMSSNLNSVFGIRGQSVIDGGIPEAPPFRAHQVHRASFVVVLD